VIRLLVTAEGYSELEFVKQVLAPHLFPMGIQAEARCVLTSKDNRKGRVHRGGTQNYEKPQKDITHWLRECSGADCRFTTMFDYYALPDEFPGMEIARRIADKYQRIASLESAFATDINDYRFIPYIQLHEFESLILAQPQDLDWEYLEHDAPIQSLVNMVGDQNPELINDGPETAPSKRIMHAIGDEYDKVTAGVSVVKHIGIPTLRERCRHFHEWLTKLENLA